MEVINLIIINTPNVYLNNDLVSKMLMMSRYYINNCNSTSKQEFRFTIGNVCYNAFLPPEENKRSLKWQMINDV